MGLFGTSGQMSPFSSPVGLGGSSPGGLSSSRHYGMMGIPMPEQYRLSRLSSPPVLDTPIDSTLLGIKKVRWRRRQHLSQLPLRLRAAEPVPLLLPPMHFSDRLLLRSLRRRSRGITVSHPYDEQYKRLYRDGCSIDRDAAAFRPMSRISGVTVVEEGEHSETARS